MFSPPSTPSGALPTLPLLAKWVAPEGETGFLPPQKNPKSSPACIPHAGLLAFKIITS